MRFVLISSDESDQSDQDQLAAFDRKLEKCLEEPRSAVVVIQLRPDMEPSIELLEWLEQWTHRLSEGRLRCIIVPRTPAQLECLELSHPDQNLVYAASIDELGPLLPAGTEPSAPMPDQQPRSDATDNPDLSRHEETRSAIPDPIFQPDSFSSANATPPVPVTGQERGESSHPVWREEAPDSENRSTPRDRESLTAAPIFAVGLVSTTSGEYTCMGCQVSRMWLKGEQMLACVNPECLNPEAGWRLEWDLF